MAPERFEPLHHIPNKNNGNIVQPANEKATATSCPINAQFFKAKNVTIAAINMVPILATSNCDFGEEVGCITFTYKSCAKADDPATNNPETVENAAETPPAAKNPTIKGLISSSFILEYFSTNQHNFIKFFSIFLLLS